MPGYIFTPVQTLTPSVACIKFRMRGGAKF